MNLRDALIRQAPSLALQREAQAEIARLDAAVARLSKPNENTLPPGWREIHHDIQGVPVAIRYDPLDEYSETPVLVNGIDVWPLLAEHMARRIEDLIADDREDEDAADRDSALEGLAE